MLNLLITVGVIAGCVIGLTCGLAWGAWRRAVDAADWEWPRPVRRLPDAAARWTERVGDDDHKWN